MRQPGAVRVELELPMEASSAPRARAALRDLLAGTPLEVRADDAAIALTELVTNALLHGRSPVVLALTVQGDVLRLEVCDANPVGPSFSLLGPTAMTGRGLLLITASADRWGVEPRADGKCVWCELDLAGDGSADVGVDALLGSWADDLDDPADEDVRVVITDLGVAPMAEAESHVQSLLRELALLLAAADCPVEHAQVAQRALNAAAELEGLRRTVKAQLTAALNARHTTMDLALTVRRGDADLIRDFSNAVDEADRLSRAGELLVIPAPQAASETRQAWLRRVLAQLAS